MEGRGWDRKKRDSRGEDLRALGIAVPALANCAAVPYLSTTYCTRKQDTTNLQYLTVPSIGGVGVSGRWAVESEGSPWRRVTEQPEMRRCQAALRGVRGPRTSEVAVPCPFRRGRGEHTVSLTTSARWSTVPPGYLGWRGRGWSPATLATAARSQRGPIFLSRLSSRPLGLLGMTNLEPGEEEGP